MLETGTCAILIFLIVMIFLRLSFVYRRCFEGGRSGLCTDPQGSKFVAPAIDKVLNEIEKPVRFSSQQLRVSTNNFSHLLGTGGFGAVYKGTFSSGLVVAVKVLSGSSDHKRIEDQFLAEVSTIGRTHHINLVQLYGFCFDKDLQALVYEYMENGSLDRLLFSKDENIEWENLHGIAIGTAKGIAYLHEDCQQRIIHYDIKPENILLDVDFCPKVADFGLAKLCNREKTHVTMTGGRGTPGYAAPELWMPFPITHKCDVYSFGMLLFEILGRRRNLDVNLPDSQEWFPTWLWKKYEKGELSDVMVVCCIEDEVKEKAESMAMTALWCVQYSPEMRPRMSAVVKMLEGGVEIPAPKNPFRHLMAASPLPDLVAKVLKELCSFHPEATRTATVSSNPSSMPIMKKYEIEIAIT